MTTFTCLICNEPTETLEGGNGQLQDGICGSCHTIHVFGPKQTIIDGKVCGMGGQLKYDYSKKPMAPLPTK